MVKWKNNKEQKQLMLEYGLNNIIYNNINNVNNINYLNEKYKMKINGIMHIGAHIVKRLKNIIK